MSLKLHETMTRYEGNTEPRGPKPLVPARKDRVIPLKIAKARVARIPELQGNAAIEWLFKHATEAKQGRYRNRALDRLNIDFFLPETKEHVNVHIAKPLLYPRTVGVSFSPEVREQMERDGVRDWIVERQDAKVRVRVGGSKYWYPKILRFDPNPIPMGAM